MPIKLLQDPRKKRIFLIILTVALISVFTIVLIFIIVYSLTDNVNGGGWPCLPVIYQNIKYLKLCWRMTLIKKN